MSSNKSFSTETSERYSRALFEVTRESNELDKTESDIKNFQLLIKMSPEIKKFLVPSRITKDYDSEINNSQNKIVIEHDKIPYISYPYEWCFEQLKDLSLYD